MTSIQCCGRWKIPESMRNETAREWYPLQRRQRALLVKTIKYTNIYTGTYISIRNDLVRHSTPPRCCCCCFFSINPVSSTGSTTTVLPVVAYHHHHYHHWFVRPRRSCYFCIGSGWHLSLSFSSRTSAWEGRNVPQPRWDVAFHNFGYQIQHRP